MGLFDRFKKGLKKTRDFVESGFNRIVAGFGVFDEDTLDELEALLIEADCGVSAATHLTDVIRDDIREHGNTKREHVLEVLRQEMRALLQDGTLELGTGLTIFLMIGVNGTGKTTTSGKLAHRYKQQGKRVMLGAVDTFRAAAIEQLKVWGERTGTPVVAHATGADPAAVTFDAIQSAKARNMDVLILDTAGRLHNKKNLMDELAKINRIIGREAADAKVISLLVLDATTGQNAVKQAEAFAEVAHIDGLVLAKLDGNAKGGVALAVTGATKAPVLLAGLGEGIDDLEDFDADAFVQSLLPEA